MVSQCVCVSNDRMASDILYKSKSNKFHSRLLFSHARNTDKINKFIEDNSLVSNIIISHSRALLCTRTHTQTQKSPNQFRRVVYTQHSAFLQFTRCVYLLTSKYINFGFNSFLVLNSKRAFARKTESLCRTFSICLSFSDTFHKFAVLLLYCHCLLVF